LVVCATNRPDMIDSALMRPGRIDYVVYVPPPNLEERIEILKIFTKNLDLKDFDWRGLSTKLENYTGAEIESICRQVSLLSLNGEIIEMSHFLNSKKLIHPTVTNQMLKSFETFKKNFYSK
jgi:transitional endoplasmic reticulum ATPase